MLNRKVTFASSARTGNILSAMPCDERGIQRRGGGGWWVVVGGR